MFKCISLVITFRLTQKKVWHAHSNAHHALKSVYRPHNHILKSQVDGAFQSRFAACLWSLKLKSGYLLNFVKRHLNIALFLAEIYKTSLGVCPILTYLLLGNCYVLFGGWTTHTVLNKFKWLARMPSWASWCPPLHWETFIEVRKRTPLCWCKAKGGIRVQYIII